MVRSLIVVCLLGCCAWAQSGANGPAVFPDFSVTEQTVAQALRNHPVLFDVADYESARQEFIRHRPAPTSGYCFRMRQRQIPVSGCEIFHPQEQVGDWPKSSVQDVGTKVPNFNVTEKSLTEAVSNYPKIMGAYGDYESVRLVAVARRSQPSRAYIYRTRACTGFHVKPALCGDLFSSAGVIHVTTY